MGERQVRARARRMQPYLIWPASQVRSRRAVVPCMSRQGDDTRASTQHLCPERARATSEVCCSRASRRGWRGVDSGRSELQLGNSRRDDGRRGDGFGCSLPGNINGNKKTSYNARNGTSATTMVKAFEVGTTMYGVTCVCIASDGSMRLLQMCTICPRR